jgi:L-2-hydroxyglutarate oxidase LhgO
MTETLELDAVVIGGGVIGLALARGLALAGREVTVLEAESRLGNHTSSRNSEVIHAGIYYPRGSLKARLCVAGKERLYDYCAEMRVPHQRVGKIIVATRDEEVATLDGILAKAHDNGVTDLEWLEARQIAELEPSVKAVRGLLSPSTGIVDSHELMSALRRDAEAHGAHVVLNSPLEDGEVLESGGFELRVGGGDPFSARCRTLVNAAGLTAQNVARKVRGLPPETIPGQYFAKGHYFTLSGRSPFRRLVYPVPVPGGLGVHVTLDMSGQARFGPDVSWLEGIDYAFDESRAASFYAAIRSYFPTLSDGSLSPGYTGIRPKLSPAGAPADDFVLQGAAEHGVPGLLNLYGIESPGLTSALALADLALAKL